MSTAAVNMYHDDCFSVIQNFPHSNRQINFYNTLLPTIFDQAARVR